MSLPLEDIVIQYLNIQMSAVIPRLLSIASPKHNNKEYIFHKFPFDPINSLTLIEYIII